MCGIIGIISHQGVTHRLMEGLKRVEYRGYDSAGLAVINDKGLNRRRASGKLLNLQEKLIREPLDGPIGIGHTRWATHGGPCEKNAHPHISTPVCVVHNGIIENHASLRKELQETGMIFESETDTEVVAHLIAFYLKNTSSFLEAVHKAIQRLEGAFALGILSQNHPDCLIGARKGSPLAVGYGKEEMFLGSDALALSHLSQEVTFLEEGDIALLQRNSIQIFDETLTCVTRPIISTGLSDDVISKEGYAHFMLKEIHEQPDVLRRILQSYVAEKNTLNFHFPFHWQNVPRLTIVACGTAYYAGCVAKHWFERLAKLPVEIDIASEFRYRQPPLPKGGVCLFISQSGETADTLAALEYAKKQGQYCIGLINVTQSAVGRGVDKILEVHAGPEIGVASTKAFFAMVSVMGLLLLQVALQRGHMNEKHVHDFLESFRLLPSCIEKLLAHLGEIQALAPSLAAAQDVLYLGRGTSFAMALEGALKLKEISYVHAEGYAAGEMKHGPIALIDEKVPVVAIAPYDELFEKTVSNIQEALARKGKMIVLCDEKGAAHFAHLADLKESSQLRLVLLPEVNALTSPLIYAIPLQVLAYEVGVLKGEDVDKPRNLAKSVTVE